MRLTVLYDDRCPLCRTFSSWLARQPTLVDLDLVPAGSGDAHIRFPTLDHERTLEEITVVSDAGIRNLTTSRVAAQGGDYPDDCAGTCAPNVQGIPQGLGQG